MNTLTDYSTSLILSNEKVLHLDQNPFLTPSHPRQEQKEEQVQYSDPSTIEKEIFTLE